LDGKKLDIEVDELAETPVGVDQKPQSPKVFLLRYILIPNTTFVLLFIRRLLSKSSPLLALIAPLHASAELLVGSTAAGGEAKTSVEGRGEIVKVGCGVLVDVSVGGTGVSVGIAVCVIAIIVFTTATADVCTCAGSMVGTAFTPHALNSGIKIVIMVNNSFDFIDFLSSFLFSGEWLRIFQDHPIVAYPAFYLGNKWQIENQEYQPD